MTHGFLTALMGLYWLAAILLQIYGVNCYVMVILFTRKFRRRIVSERFWPTIVAAVPFYALLALGARNGWGMFARTDQKGS